MNLKSIVGFTLLAFFSAASAVAQTNVPPAPMPPPALVEVLPPPVAPFPPLPPAEPLSQISVLALPRIVLHLPMLLTLQPMGAGEQVKDDLFAGTEKFAQGASNVTEVNLDPSMMGSLGGSKSDAAHKMDFMVVRTYKYDKPGMYKQDDVDVFRKRLADGSWNCSVHVRSKDKSTDICSRPGPDHETNETVIITSQPLGLTFIHMRGRESLGDLENLKRLTPRPPAPPTPPAKPDAN
jgi:hypothetical protein